MAASCRCVPALRRETDERKIKMRSEVRSQNWSRSRRQFQGKSSDVGITPVSGADDFCQSATRCGLARDDSQPGFTLIPDGRDLCNASKASGRETLSRAKTAPAIARYPRRAGFFHRGCPSWNGNPGNNRFQRRAGRCFERRRGLAREIETTILARAMRPS